MRTDVPESVVGDPRPGSLANASHEHQAWRTTDSGGLARCGARVALALRMARYRFSTYIFCHLWLFKLVFAVLRLIRPVALFGNTVVLTKMHDIREVLGRFDDFTLGEVIEPGMPWGPFLMTVDWKEQHRRERGLLQGVVKRDADQQAIRTIVADECSRRISSANGRIDMVAELAEPVVVRIASHYFGVPALKGDLHAMARATRNLAGIIMVNPPIGSPPWISSREDIVGVTQLILEQISATRSAITNARQNDLPDTLLTRLTSLLHAGDGPKWFNEDWIRRYLTGLVATGLATVVRGTTQTVDQLVARPDRLREAQKLAVALDRAESEQDQLPDTASDSERKAAAERVEQAHDALQHYIYEALRFRPMLPLLVRDAPRATVVAKGTPRVRVIPGGARILAGPLAGMFDPEVFPNPYRFDPERPIESYIHFGDGDRRCFGKYIAENALMGMVRALLRLPGLARAPGRDGQIHYEGPAPCSFVLTFNQASIGAAQR